MEEKDKRMVISHLVSRVQRGRACLTTGIFIYILTFTDILVLAQWSAVRILELVMGDCGSGDASLSILLYLYLGRLLLTTTQHH